MYRIKECQFLTHQQAWYYSYLAASTYEERVRFVSIVLFLIK